MKNKPNELLFSINEHLNLRTTGNAPNKSALVYNWNYAVRRTPYQKITLMKNFILFMSLLIFPLVVCGQTSDALQVSQLANDFYVFTTYQTYNGEKVGANGSYLVTNSGVVIFDPPWDETQTEPLLNHIKTKHGKNVVMSFSTHFHEDRTNGIELLKSKGVKTYTTVMTDRLSQKRGFERAEFLLDKDTKFTVGQYEFQTFYPGAGHSPDNIVVWFPKEKILHGGCFVKSTEATTIGNLSDANINEWSNSVRNVQGKFKNPKYIIPGHDGWQSLEALNHTLKLVKENQKGSKN